MKIKTFRQFCEDVATTASTGEIANTTKNVDFTPTKPLTKKPVKRYPLDTKNKLDKYL